MTKLKKQPVRERFLIRYPHGDWERVWSKAWRDYPGEKKIVSGRTVILHLLPAEKF